MSKQEQEVPAWLVAIMLLWIAFVATSNYFGTGWAIAIFAGISIAIIALKLSVDEHMRSEAEALRHQNLRIAEESRRRSKEFLSGVMGKVGDVCDTHKHSLAREKRRLTRRDAYGNLITDDWERGSKGVEYFINSVIIPLLGETGWKQANSSFKILNQNSEFKDELARMVNASADSVMTSYVFSENMDGIEYESFCSQILEGQGWQVEQTVASGDQGVDLIAIKPGVRVCIQCKRYSSPVGNSAVQQVAAGRLHWQGTHSAVVTNAGYTPSAEELARSTSVLLLHHEDLRNLEQLLI
jgi:restriction system protein